MYEPPQQVSPKALCCWYVSKELHYKRLQKPMSSCVVGLLVVQWLLLLHWKELFEFGDYLIMVRAFVLFWVWWLFFFSPKCYSSYFSSKSEKWGDQKARQSSWDGEKYRNSSTVPHSNGTCVFQQGIRDHFNSREHLCSPLLEHKTMAKTGPPLPKDMAEQTVESEG